MTSHLSASLMKLISVKSIVLHSSIGLYSLNFYNIRYNILTYKTNCTWAPGVVPEYVSWNFSM